jgi:hypothetical protein
MGRSAFIGLQNLDAPEGQIYCNALPATCLADQGGSAMVLDENARAGDWRKRVLHCRNRGVSLNREVIFALAIADLLKLPDDLPLMPAVKAVMSY